MRDWVPKQPITRSRTRRRGSRLCARTVRRDTDQCECRIPPSAMRTYCALDDAAMKLLAVASAKRQFSARALDRVARVARTIADLAESPAIRAEHVAEAVQYRSLERLDGRAA
ncbi:MAG: magnesium chelatase subunit ChlI family protein [Burkholderiales bacterium]